MFDEEPGETNTMSAMVTVVLFSDSEYDTKTKDACPLA